MAGTKKKESHSSLPHKKHALGRGLAALIPTAEDIQSTQPVSAMDVLFPQPSSVPTSRQRGGSARDLLGPGRSSSRHFSERQTDTAKSVSPTVSGENNDNHADNRIAASNETATNSPNVSRETLQEKGNFDGSLLNETESKNSDTALHQSNEEALIQPPSASYKSSTMDGDINTEEKNTLTPIPGVTVGFLPLEWIVPNTRQPRQIFDDDELSELSASIEQVGILQPIVVRPIDSTQVEENRLQEELKEKPDARYELVMGERRLRASELAGLHEIPAIVRRTEDKDLLRDALLENLHRADLNPLEEASAYAQLMNDFGTTQEQLASKIARSRSQIANTLRLLRLPSAIQRMVAAKVLSAGHARAILALDNEEQMEILARRIVAEGLSVRTTEELVRLGKYHKVLDRKKIEKPATVSAMGQNIVERLSEIYDTRVTIVEGRNKGRIIIEFAGKDDLERIQGLIRSSADAKNN